MSQEQIQQVLAGGTAACADAGVPVGGGHTIDAPEPIYGLAVIGLVPPDRIKRNSDARDGDVLVLGKGLGVGILGAAMNKDELDPDGYREMVESTTKLNSIGADLAGMEGVHALRLVQPARRPDSRSTLSADARTVRPERRAGPALGRTKTADRAGNPTRRRSTLLRPP